MGYRQNVKKLKKFLRDKKVLTKFKLNCINDAPVEPTNFGKALRKKYNSYSIGSAFIWSNTPEGHEFWQRLDEEFRRLRG